ncbi:hypothetical protein FB451DRAFT_1184521 [Mycena latifolia]|nr:hypothetical protein FB451DRAFT_1184521 [Mycena latifolia]
MFFTGLHWIPVEFGGELRHYPADADGDWRGLARPLVHNAIQRPSMATDNQWWPPAAANELSSGGYITRKMVVFTWSNFPESVYDGEVYVRNDPSTSDLAESVIKSASSGHPPPSWARFSVSSINLAEVSPVKCLWTSVYAVRFVSLCGAHSLPSREVNVS